LSLGNALSVVNAFARCALVSRRCPTFDRRDDYGSFLRDAEEEDAPGAYPAAISPLAALHEFDVSLKRVLRHLSESGLDAFQIRRRDSIKRPFCGTGEAHFPLLRSIHQV